MTPNDDNSSTGQSTVQAYKEGGEAEPEVAKKLQTQLNNTTQKMEPLTSVSKVEKYSQGC